jgi:hypothetical protein
MAIVNKAVQRERLTEPLTSAKACPSRKSCAKA